MFRGRSFSLTGILLISSLFIALGAGSSLAASVDTPIFMPWGGTYSRAQNVVIIYPTAGATIRYTTDGSDPNTFGTVIASGGNVIVDHSLVLRVFACKDGMTASSKSATYNIVVATPSFGPVAGTYNSARSVTIACATAGATIHYTMGTDSNVLPDPTESDPVVASGARVLVDHNLTLKAKAWNGVMTPSAVRSGAYAFVVATPVFSPVGGTYDTEQNVVITCATSDATIHYTTNGVDPNESDPVVASGACVLVDHDLTLKAKAWNGAFAPSAVKSGAYVFVAAAPVFSPVGGTYSTEQNVVITCATSDATIHYTTSGVDPMESDPVVASGSSVYVDQSLTLKAKAWKGTISPSAVKSDVYTLTVATPAFSPAAGIYGDLQNVVITCATTGATIHYTTNGVDPTESDPVISGASVLVDHSLTLKAKAWKGVFSPSAIKSGAYGLVVATPVFSPVSGTYDTEQNVVITCATSDATIRYTTNGMDPNESDPAVTSGSSVPVGQSVTLKARVWKNGFTSSVVASSSYTLKCAAPALTPDTGVHVLDVNVVVTCTTPGATIHYTLNGSAPSEGDPAVANGGTVTVSVNPVTVLRVRVFKVGWSPSDIRSAMYSYGMSHSPGRVIGWGIWVWADLSGPYAKVATGDSGCSLALRADGSIVAWGDNTYGQAIPPSGMGFTAIAAGYSHSLALKADGSIAAWGSNEDGKASPPTGTGFTAIAAGYCHSLALRADGSIAAWGDNSLGQATPPSGTGFTAIAAGAYHSLALRADGSIVAWGYNESGQATPPSGTGFVAIAAGRLHSLALRTDGSILGWGSNYSSGGTYYGQATPPAGTGFTAIAAGEYHSLALRANGSLMGWGSNYAGSLGATWYGQATPPSGTGFTAIAAGVARGYALRTDGSIVEWGNAKPASLSAANFTALAASYSNVLALRSDGSILCFGSNEEGEGISPSGTDFVAIAAGMCHSLALRADGSILGWGENFEGQLPSGTGFRAIAAGLFHSLAIRADGSIAGWGRNIDGQATPPSGTGFVAVAAGYTHSLALRADGSIVGWGSNYDYLGNYIGQATPPSGTGFVAIAAGDYHSLALRADGSIAGWGSNYDYYDTLYYGQATPPSGTGFAAIAAGPDYSLALRADGSIVGWGDNYDPYGELYYGQATPPSGTGFTAIAAGLWHGFAIRNLRPIAQAGADQSLVAPYGGKVSVVLEGAASSDPESDPITYRWSWSVAGEDFNSTDPNFTCELPVGTYTFTLVVNDGLTDSEPNTCTVTVIENQLPVANAGPDQMLYVDHTGKVTVTLDGSASSDPEGATLTYQWTGTINGTAFTSTEASPSVELPVGTYTFSLVVNDGLDVSAADTCTVTVVAPKNADILFIPRLLNVQSHENRVMAIMTIRGATRAEIDPAAPVTMWPFGTTATHKSILGGFSRGPKVVVIVAAFDAQPILDSCQRTTWVWPTIETKLRSGQYVTGRDFVLVWYPPRRGHH